MLRRVRHISDLAQISYVRQKEQLGLGHAVLMAKELVGHEPFAVILSDDVVAAERPCIGQLIHAYEETHSSVVAVMEVPPDETGRYGIIDPAPPNGEAGRDPRLHRVKGLVEKPPAGTAPSNLAIIGRYVLTPKIFEKLEQTPHGAGGEIQLTDAIEALMEEQDIYGYAFEGMRYDAGTTMGWLKASVELALAAAGHRRGVAALPRRARPARSRRGRIACRRSAQVLGHRYELEEHDRPPVAWPPSGAPATSSSAARWPSRSSTPSTVATRTSWRGSARRRRPSRGLSHPNIVSVFDLGTDEAGPYIVMELVDGQDLATILHDRGAIRRDRPARASRCRSRTPWPRPTRAASSIATSSPATSC